MSAIVRFVLWFAVIFGAIGAIIHYAFADFWTVPGDDPRMALAIQPMLEAGDVVLVKRHGQNALGNLLRCADPDEPRRFVMGRMVAAGSTVHITGQHFMTPGSRPTGSGSCPAARLVNPATSNEVELLCREEDFGGTTYQIFVKANEGGEETTQDLNVPNGKAFLLSDNRYMHLDSRDFGMVDEMTCHQIFFRMWGGQGFMDAKHRFNLIW
jgi:signal peptidase I